MSIGKDSIQKRVAKEAPAKEPVEAVVEKAPDAPKAPKAPKETQVFKALLV